MRPWTCKSPTSSTWTRARNSPAPNLPACCWTRESRSAWTARAVSWTISSWSASGEALKYEEVYLKAYDTVKEAKAGIGQYMNFYNYERLHQALGYKTAWEAHHGLDKQPWPKNKNMLIEGKNLDYSLPKEAAHNEQ